MTLGRLISRVMAVIMGIIILILAVSRTREARRENEKLARRQEEMSAPVLAPFRLTSQEGKPVSSEDLQGRVWVADFIFTRCQGPCPMLTQKMGDLVKLMGQPDLRFVSFSVDPNHDKPAVLKKYAAAQGADDPRWFFLTGPADDIQKIVRDGFKLPLLVQGAAKDAAVDVQHSMKFVLVDKSGRIRGYYDVVETSESDPLAAVKRDILKLL